MSVTVTALVIVVESGSVVVVSPLPGVNEGTLEAAIVVTVGGVSGSLEEFVTLSSVGLGVLSVIDLVVLPVGASVDGLESQSAGGLWLGRMSLPGKSAVVVGSPDGMTVVCKTGGTTVAQFGSPPASQHLSRWW